VKIKKNLIYNFIMIFSKIGIPLLYFPHVLRVLKPENIGKINFSISFVSYFLLISSLGLTTYAIRKSATIRSDRFSLSIFASEIYSINIIFTLISYAFMTIIIVFSPFLHGYTLLILIQSSVIISTTLGTEWINQATEDFKFISLRNLIFQVVSLVFIFIFVNDQSDYIIYLMISILSIVGSSIINILYRKTYCDIKFTFIIKWREHLKPILFLFVMMLSVTIFNSADVTMLGILRDDYSVGIYSAANKVSRIVSQIIQSAIFVFLPSLSVYFSNKDYINLNILLNKIFQFNITIGIPIVVVIFFMSEEIVFILGGFDYYESANVLKFLIISFFFSLIGGSFLGNAILIPSGNEKQYMLITIVTAICNILLNSFLIPVYGAVGAAMSTAVNGLLIFLLLIIRIPKYIKIKNFFKTLISPIIGSIITVVFLEKVTLNNDYFTNSLMKIALSIPIYTIILLITNNDFIKSVITFFIKQKSS
jgi:O-antigen/teichoic acid export membrane protein